MVNKVRCAELADFLESLPPKKFDMTVVLDRPARYAEDEESFLAPKPSLDDKIGEIRTLFKEARQQNKIGECKTVGCIAGWTLLYFDVPMERDDSYTGRAMEALDLTYLQSSRLFTPADFTHVIDQDEALRLAIRQLRRLAAGEWDISPYWILPATTSNGVALK